MMFCDLYYLLEQEEYFEYIREYHEESLEDIYQTVLDSRG
jgi:hypothetical protein